MSHSAILQIGVALRTLAQSKGMNTESLDLIGVPNPEHL